MKRYRPGEVVLLAFPFTGSPDAKRRPALVLMDTGDEDLILGRITSEATKSPFDVELVEWKRAGLMLPSVVRIHKVATMEKRLIERSLGSLTASDWEKVRRELRKFWSSV